MTAPTPDQLRDVLAEEVLDAPTLADVRPRLDVGRRRPWWPVLAASIGVVAVLGGTTWALTGGPDGAAAGGPVVERTVPTVLDQGVCFGEADPDTGLQVTYMFSVAASEPVVNAARAAENARSVCGWHWQGGVFTTTPDPGSGELPEPDPGLALAICVLADGSLGTFPGPEAVCGELGLPIADLS